MKAWISLFSQFTAEALLLEALLACILIAGYCIYWILSKRRYGVIKTTVPAGIVKTYLAQLVGDAEQLRGILFGLLGGTGNPNDLLALRTNSAPQVGAPTQLDPALEAKNNELQAALNALNAEKDKLVADLAAAQSNAGQQGDNSALLARIKELEEKLAEYAIIEDDLANLKRLTQENAQLKAQLAAGGGSAVSAAPAAPVAPAPAPAEPQVPAPAPVAAAPAPATPAEAPKDFEDVVNKVEALMQADPPKSEPEPQAAAPSPAPASPPAAAATPPPSESEKSDADLVAEFEKMLSS